MLNSRARVVLDTLLPSQTHPDFPYGLFDTNFENFYLEFAQTANKTLRLSFRFALFTAIWISPLLIRHIPPVTRYSRETRERALAAMETSRLYLLRQMLLI